MDEELQNWAAEMTCQDTCDIKVSFFFFLFVQSGI